MQQSESQVAVIPQTAEIVKADDNWPGLRKFGAGAFTSLDLTQLPDRKLFVQAQQGEPKGLDKFINTEIAIRHILFHPAKREDVQTGEIEFWTRLVLILSDGSLISCGSQGIMKSLQLATVLFGPPPWPGLRGKVTQRQLAPDRRWYEINWDLEQELCQTTTPMTVKNGTPAKNRAASPKSS